MVDLTTTYLGLEAEKPAGGLGLPAFEEGGDGPDAWKKPASAAVVMYSLFEEQIIHESLALDHFLNRGTESFAEALTYFPDLEHYNVGPEDYLDLIRKAKQAVSIPVIGSLNGVSTGGWVDYARKIEEAGADALELNMYYVPTDLNVTSRGAGGELRRPGAGRPRARSTSRWRSSSAPSSPPCPTWPRAWWRPAPTGWCCSTASTSPTWTWRPWKWSPTWC